MAERIRILIVDDHPAIRKGLIAALEPEPDMEIVGSAATGIRDLGENAARAFHNKSGSRQAYRNRDHRIGRRDRMTTVGFVPILVLLDVSISALAQMTG